MLQVTNRGVVIDRLNDIYTKLSEQFKAIYGQDINLNADTPDGQMIGIFSQSLSDINEVILFIIQMLDPYNATGSWLEQRALYAGVVRRGAEYSYINDVAIIGDRVVTIPKGAVLTDGNGVKWVTVNDITLNANGSARTILRSQDLGAFSLAMNESLTFETVYTGVRGATALIAATEGIEEETDVQLLQRFMMSHSINNYDDRQGVQAALSSLTDVKKVLVLENYTNETDTDTGLPMHSINAIVLGGDDQEIALTLLKKTGGVAFFGQTEVTLFHEGMNRRVWFDRPALVPVTVELTYKRLKNLTDLAQEEIKETLMAQDFAIAENVYAMRLVCGINDQENFALEAITVNGSDKVEIGWREYAVINDVEITIT